MAKKGRNTERIVAILESKINPNAIIERNRFLPDLSNPGHVRECDVVITERINKRKIITIVEVQNRSSKVTIGEYNNFYNKMRDVGANRLIVVSKQAFPQSIIDKAKIHGPAVQLINLNNLDANSFDVGSIICFYDIYDNKVNATFSKDGYVFSNKQKSEIGIKIEDMEHILRLNDKMLSYLELFDILKESYNKLEEGIHDFEFVVRAHDGLSVKIDEVFFPMAIVFNGKMKVTKTFVTDLAEYRPICEENPLMFVSDAIVMINGEEKKVTLTYEWIEEYGAYNLIPEPIEGVKMMRIGSVKRNTLE